MTLSNPRRMTVAQVFVLATVLGCQMTPTVPEATVPSASLVETPTPGEGAGSSDTSSTAGLDCPEPPIELGDLLPMDPVTRLACFGNRQVDLVAYIPWQEHVCGDTGIQPSWLGGCAEVISISSEASDFSASLTARVHPSTGLQASDLPLRTWVHVTGRHDDPAARTCRHIPAPGAIAQPLEATILECRQQFVIIGLQEASPP